MNLFLLEQKSAYFEHPHSVVVWASSAGEARRLATEQTHEAVGADAWIPKYAYARKVGLEKTPKVVLCALG